MNTSVKQQQDKIALTIQLNSFFVCMNVSSDRIKTLMPVWVEKFSGCDLELFSELLHNLIETWDTGQLPNIPQVITQYKILCNKKNQRENVKNLRLEAEATTASEKFWSIYNKLKSEGKDLNEIVRGLSGI